MFGLAAIDLITIFVYFLIVIIIGIWASRRIHSQEDYFLGGRRFGKFVQTFAAFGQGTSAESAVGMTVTVYRNGIAGVWQALTAVFGLPVYWITSVWYRRMRLLTLGDFFEERYDSKGLAGLYAIISSIFFMIIIGLGFTAMSRTITAIAAKPVYELTVSEKMEYDKALHWETLENSDYDLLDNQERQTLEELRLLNPRKEFSYINENLLIWVVAAIVIFYAILGGLEAAFLTDTLQGVFIVILSLLLLPFAFMKINTVTGGSGIEGVIEAAKSKLPQASFEIWGSPAMVDFTWYYLIAIMVVSQINVAIQANQLIACGSAKDEYTARFGFTTGIFIKRAATLVWGISALMLVILYQDVIKNPDYLWGHACRDLLGELNIGLVGLMIACLMAALMSTADALMLTASSLLTHNVFRPFYPKATESQYVWAGRIFGFIVIFGGVMFAYGFDNIFQIIKLCWEFNIALAAGFWMGLKWRRANKPGAWASMAGALIFFGLLQVVIPMFPGIKTNSYLQKTVQPMVMEKTFIARNVDVINRHKEIDNWLLRDARGMAKGNQPDSLEVGEAFHKTFTTPKHSIFWTKGLKVDEKDVITGSGMLSLELIIIDSLISDLSKNTYALNETIRLLVRSVIPFLILIVVSLLTRRDDKKRLDRFFVKMKTPAGADREVDAQEIERSYQNPTRFDYKKMFPNSEWEFEKLDNTALKGIIFFTIGGIIILMLVYLVAYLGK